ncbi:MAG: outer membrane beta-barrel protein [Porphyromonadaceae bacterium]|nr:outer membrane beta-barrel protein [Porphyromonadaceae bacterium]
MRKILLTSVVCLACVMPILAGGVLTNTNQHVSFLRMVARGASIGISGAYYNPAGTAFMNDGIYLSFNGQSVYQTRTIDSKFMLGTDMDFSHKYKGKASAPFLPNVMAAYKKGNLAFSGSFGIIGGGGKASFNEGLPMFSNAVHAAMAMQKIPTKEYSINSSLDGSQMIWGLQMGAAYKFNDWLSGYAGGRMNYFTGGYEGFLQASLRGKNPVEVVGIDLDCTQTGWGLTPILGLDAKLGKFNIGLKYEFITKMNIENKTKKSEYRIKGVPQDINSPLAAYKDGVNTPNDIPALLSAAVQYSILPSLRASVEYHYYFDKQAGMAQDKQKSLDRGTIEYLAGIEWDVTKILTISAGYQNTNYGQTDGFQSDTSFSCDSYSIGLGAEVKLNKHLNLNVGYFWTNYSDYKMKAQIAKNIASDNTYSRTNKVFGLGIDYKF